jgi:hypothetical protein
LLIDLWGIIVPGAVQVSVFTNFEGGLNGAKPADVDTAANAVAWFRDCAAAFPEIVWTHLYSPRYLLVQDGIDAVFTPYLLDAMQNEGAEIGIHAHLYFDMVSRSGVTPRSTPDGSSDDCSPGAADGYGVLLTGYEPAERARIAAAAIEGLTFNGFPAPTTFCAGYSAADAELQTLLDGLGFSASFAAQPIPPRGTSDSYPGCWHDSLEWSGHISPLTMPYRVNRHTILPPPHDESDYLDLVEVPLNMWVDTFRLTLDGHEVSREDMFDRHVTWAGSNADSSAVAIGVHAEVVAGERFADGTVAQLVTSFLNHVRDQQENSDVDITFSTASDIAAVFLANTTTGAVD